MPDRESSRLLSRSLSAYLCGTHSGLLASRRRDRLDLDELSHEHSQLVPGGGEVTIRLGELRWQPAPEARGLANALRRSLDRPGVVDLILYGSQARGGTTGFSDVDAILVLDDAVADDAGRLRSLRSDVLSAQRAVLAHQPMQHHGFEVATPKLLSRAGESLALPAVAVSETGSLFGRGVAATFEPDRSDRAKERLATLVSDAIELSNWPRHPWHLHVSVSKFELLPTLYLQALGRAVPKSRSFDEARQHFGDAWWPYDVLDRVRDAWPRSSRPALRAAARGFRNPWVMIAGWTRFPAAPPDGVRDLLRGECLGALRTLAGEMGDRAR